MLTDQYPLSSKLPAICRLLAIPLLSLSLLYGCTSSAEKEAQLKDPKIILEKSRTAFVEKKYKAVFRLLFPLAVEGNAEAQYALGYMYHHGLGLEKDDSQAMQWIQRAASQGYAKARRALK
ncbi:tetratricopeptide repeat protein [endosymbiont of Lamellibrachia barhami]|uniref:tetratricopeptide repeat protein n=1 Tax=endosymbiont of Lamellibrachia barhami TaxID=205975 RepID=UPI0015B0BACF|nr:SEL1-like repeat protein [endosymbiont of Lamellibrachia barhami]